MKRIAKSVDRAPKSRVTDRTEKKVKPTTVTKSTTHATLKRRLITAEGWWRERERLTGIDGRPPIFIAAE